MSGLLREAACLSVVAAALCACDAQVIELFPNPAPGLTQLPHPAAPATPGSTSATDGEPTAPGRGGAPSSGGAGAGNGGAAGKGGAGGGSAGSAPGGGAGSEASGGSPGGRDAGAPLDAGVGGTKDASDGATVVGGSGPRADAAADAGGPLPIHRYRFAGTGTTAVDDVGGADGVILGGAVLDDSGRLLLDGNDDYVDLPNGLVSALSDATFSAWLEWRGNNCWHRIFSFGSTVEGEDVVGDRQTELLMTPENCAIEGQPRGVTVLLELASAVPTDNAQVLTDVAFGAETLRNAVLVFDDGALELRLYLDGELIGVGPTLFRLSDLEDVNNWLGRSQWVQDFNLPGVYDSFEIYDSALSAADVAAVYSRGPR